jgi:BNR repeat-containing family member
MHAYTPDDFPNDYFNYQRTAPGAAMVNDENFTTALFSTKQLFVNPNVSADTYYKITYPNFLITEQNRLFLTYRMGGTTSAEIIFHQYDPDVASWEGPWHWNTQSSANSRTGIYGEYRQQQGKIYFAWQRRMIVDQNEGYQNNKGLYLAYTDNVSTARGGWQSVDGVEQNTPVSNLEMYHLGDPSGPGESMVGSGGGASLPYVVTPEGCFHSMIRVDGMERHCYMTSLNTSLIVSPYEIEWASVSIFYVQGRVFRIGLEHDRPIIQSTEPGSDDWRHEYQAQSGFIFTHGVATLSDNTIFYYLMQRKPVSSDKRPLHVLRFDIQL